MSELIVERDGCGIVRLTLNRPRAMNALSTSLESTLCDAMVEIRDDDEVRVVIITGAGRAFCAGIDLKEAERIGFGNRLDRPPGERLPDLIAGLEVPVIGAINGVAITGGFELALMCDVLIASSEARFADTHARVGVVPGWGLSQQLPRIIGVGRAKELSLTGNFLDAATACEWGLVNRVCEPEALMPSCQSLAEDMASCDAGTQREIKRLIDLGWHSTLDEGLRAEDECARRTNAKVSGEQIQNRRQQVQSRGRDQLVP